MFTNIKSYKNTSVDWAKSQALIMKLLREKGINDVRFTNISHETAVKAGFTMEDETSAIMIEFMKNISLANGVGGKVPIRIIIPNVPDDEKMRNQAYRILFWYLKTKFEAIETGLIEFEKEFMAHIALGKNTVWEEFKQKMLPQILGGDNPDMGLLSLPKGN